MRVAVVFFPVKQDRLLQTIAKAITTGIEKQGHHPDIINGNVDRGKKLTSYQYIVFIAETIGLLAKLPNTIRAFANDAGNLIGKRSSAFILKGMLGSEKALLKLMKLMESEGLYLTYSDIFKNEEEALHTGERLHIVER